MSKESPTSTTTREQIAELQQRIADLKITAVEELKVRIKEANALVADLEKELAEFTGSPVKAPEKQKRVRRASFTDEELHASVRTVLAENPDGITASGIARVLDISYFRIKRHLAGAFLKDRNVFRKSDSGSGSKLFLP